MTPASRVLIIIASLSLLAATQLSALGFHALASVLGPAKQASWQWANQLQFYHSLGLILVALLAPRLKDPRLAYWAGGIMVLGLLLFSGSIYLGSLGVPGVGQVAPLGGGSFMLAWLLVAIAAFRTPAAKERSP